MPGNKDSDTLWDKVKTNFGKYADELRVLRHSMRDEHLPRFKHGSLNPFDQENYPHLLRNVVTEAFRAMPRTLSGLFLIWVAFKLYGCASG